MNFVTILDTHGKAKATTINIKLKTLGDQLFDNKWAFIPGVSSCTKPVILNEECEVEIGNSSLSYNCDLKELTRAGYVLAVEHMFHKYRHVQQSTTEAKRIIHADATLDEKRMTDIIRRDFVSTFYDYIYTANYNLDPGEMDAEVYGIQKTMEYFESDPITSYEEAEHILYQFMTCEDYGHSKELSNYDIKSLDDIISAFKDLRFKSVHHPYILTTDSSVLLIQREPPEWDMTKEFLTADRFISHRKEFERCHDATILDKILEQTIILDYPDQVKRIPRLEKELIQCKRAMNKRIFTPKTTVIPADRISYTQSDINEDFIKAVNAIPIENDLKL